MARGSDPDSRPISVAELMARAKEQGATDVADAAAASPASTGRRHRGGKGAVSVAELTGEIPRIAEPTTPPPTRDFNAADVAERTAADGTDADAKPVPEPETPPKAAAPSDQDTAAQRRIDYAGDETKVQPKVEAATKPAAAAESDADTKTDAKPDDQSHTTAQPVADQHSDEETTGVIASVQAYSQVDENRDDDHRALSAAEREREFERYRNFEDVDETPAPPSEPKKRKLGVFGRGRKKDATAAPAPTQTAPDYPDNTDHEVTQLIPMVTAPQPPTTAPEGNEAPVPVPVVIPDPDPVPSPPPGAVSADTGRYLRFDVDDTTSAPPARDDDAADEATAKVDISKTEPAQPANRAYSAVPDNAKVVDDPGATAASPAVESQSQDTDAVRTRLTESAAARTDADHAPVEETHEKSPAIQWLLLIGQVVAGLAVGVALFWGFTELWRWNVYFALVLAVAVIFGLVTLVHVVRRSQDLISTLLALGVGLLVTIGPLVLLLVAGD